MKTAQLLMQFQICSIISLRPLERFCSFDNLKLLRLFFFLYRFQKVSDSGFQIQCPESKLVSFPDFPRGLGMRLMIAMPKRYYCDYCKKSFPDNPQSRKRHLNGIGHKRNRRMHYDSMNGGYSSLRFIELFRVFATNTLHKGCGFVFA